MAVTKKQFISGAKWRLIETFSAKGVSFVVSIILARLLMPEDYGLLALTAVFTTFSDMLIDSGFSTALIRKDKVDEYDYSSVLLMSLTIATVLYVGIFLAAPAIGRCYAEPQLPSVLRVITLVLFVQAFNSTRNANIARNMRFKLQFQCNFVACAISGILGIVLAYMGFGIWALVTQQLTQSVIGTALMFLNIKWDFKFIIDTKRLLEMLKFGSGVVGSSFLNYLASSISSAIIGKHFSVRDLGYCDKGGQIPMQISLYTFSSLSSVLLPTLSSHQNNLEDVKRILRKVTKMTAFVIIPIMAGLALTSGEIITILLTEKWLPALKIMQYSCLYYLATPFMLINVQLFFVLGHSYIRVKTEIIRLLMILASLGVCIWLGWDIYELSLASSIIAVLVSLITFYEGKKLINYTFVELFKDFIKPSICGLLMIMCVAGAGKALVASGINSVWVLLLVKVIVGVASYSLTTVLIKPESYYDVLEMIKDILNRRKKIEE